VKLRPDPDLGVLLPERPRVWTPERERLCSLVGPAFFASSAPAGPTDPNFSNVVLLLHGDGANGSTTFTDSSPSARTVTRTGSSAISTAESMFGGSSINAPSTNLSGATVDYTVASGMRLNTGDFTAEGWFRRTTTSGSGWMLAFGDGNNVSMWMRQFSSNLLVEFGWNNSSWGLQLTTSGFTFAANTWYHIAIVRNGATFTVYVAGTSRASGTWSGGDIDRGLTSGVGTAYLMRSGGLTSVADPGFNGYMDDFRLTKGVARYTSNFTVPAAAFPDA
jgi:hypothetical protein